MASGPTEFDKEFPDLYRKARALALRLTGDPTVADDLAAEAMARTLVRWQIVARVPHRDAWVLRVTTNLALDTFRRAKTATAALAAMEHAASPATTNDAEVVVLRQALVIALAKLPRRQREAVALVYLVGMDPGEAARSMRVSASSVSAHLRRGLDRLKDLLDDQPLPAPAGGLEV